MEEKDLHIGAVYKVHEDDDESVEYIFDIIKRDGEILVESITLIQGEEDHEGGSRRSRYWCNGNARVWKGFDKIR